MNFWDRLFQALGFIPEQRTYHLDEQTRVTLRGIARREQRSEEDVAAELISYALAQRQAVDLYFESWEALSSREQEVTALACLNYTNQQIAADLGISPETVKSHMRNILTKFGLRRKSELRTALSSWDFSAWKRPLR